MPVANSKIQNVPKEPVDLAKEIWRQNVEYARLPPEYCVVRSRKRGISWNRRVSLQEFRGNRKDPELAELKDKSTLIPYFPAGKKKKFLIK